MSEDNIIVVAEGTEFEREIRLSLPRGKANRGITYKIIQSIQGMEGIFGRDQENISLTDLGQAMETMFEFPQFYEVLLPTVLGLRDSKTGSISKEDQDWLDSLTDMDCMTAYVEAAGFIAQNGDMGKQVEAAQKKSRGGSGGAKSS